MALENLTPVTRKESILNGEDITPVTREEYFWKQAATNDDELPAVTAADNGDVLGVVNGAWGKMAAPKGFVTLDPNLELAGLFQQTLTTELPKAITAGLGVPVYHAATGVAAQNVDDWDAFMGYCAECYNDGVIPQINVSGEIFAPGSLYAASSGNTRARIGGMQIFYSYNNYEFVVTAGFYLMVNPNLADRKEYGVQTLIELIKAPNP